MFSSCNCKPEEPAWNVRFGIWFGLVVLCPVLALGADEQVKPPEKHTFRGIDSNRPLLTIFVPAGWQMETLQGSTEGNSRIVFSEPGVKLPYAMLEVKAPSTDSADQQSAANSELPERALLNGDDRETWYHDSSRNLNWTKSLTNPTTVHVEVVSTRGPEYTFHFFEPAGQPDALAKRVTAIMDNCRFYNAEKELDLLEAEVDAVTVNPDLFRTTEPRWQMFRSPWFWGVIVTVAGLYVIERRIRILQHRKVVDEVNQKQAERQAANRKTVRKNRKDADAYMDRLRRR